MKRPRLERHAEAFETRGHLALQLNDLAFAAANAEPQNARRPAGREDTEALKFDGKRTCINPY